MGSDDTMTFAMRKQTGTIIKLGITAVGLWIAFSQVNVVSIATKLLTADWRWVLLAFGLFNASLVVRAFRWRLLILGLGATVRFGRLVELYFAANFFNSVLPSGLTGDVIRAVEVAQDVPKSTAAGTVIIDRATGLMALFMLTLMALPLVPADFPRMLLYQIVLVCSVGLIGGFVMLEGRFMRWFGRWVPDRLRPLWGKFDHVLAAVELCGWRSIWMALLISLFFNLMQIGWWWAAGQALGYQIPFIYYFLATPLMSLATLMPSVGGLGIRETMAPVLFAPAGLLPAEAVALSLLVFGVERLSGLLGAPIYIWSVFRQNRQKVQKETVHPT
jgi:uncharacterized protein (TIRG00374 family)